VKTRERGFTLVEIMIVVAVMGLLTAVAVPNFVKSRTTATTNVCHANAAHIQKALDIAAVSSNVISTANLEAGGEGGAPPIVGGGPSGEGGIPSVGGGGAGQGFTIAGIIVPDYLKSMPVCAKGRYSTDENGNVSCSFHHSFNDPGGIAGGDENVSP